MYRLTATELRIIGATELAAQTPISEVARRARVKSHTAAYYLQKLCDSEILGPCRPSIDCYRLGYTDFHSVFSLVSNNAARRAKFIAWLKASPAVVWLAEIGGEHQLAMSLRTKSAREPLIFMSQLSARFPNMVRGQQLCLVSAVHSYGRRYLHGSNTSNNAFLEPFKNRFSAEGEREIEYADWQILSALSELSYTSERDAARQLGISPSTFRRRLAQLEEEGIVNGYYHHVDAGKLGYQEFKLLIFSRGQDPAFLAGLQEFAQQQGNVVHYLESLGAWQAELVVEVEDAARAAHIARALHDKLEVHIESISVVPIFQHLKDVAIPPPQISKGGEPRT